MVENILNQNSSKYKTSILSFGIFSLPGLVLALFQVYSISQGITLLDARLLAVLQQASLLVGILGFLIFARGMNALVSPDAEEVKKEGKRISRYYIILFLILIGITIFGMFHFLMIGDSLMISTLLDINILYSPTTNYLASARFWSISILILFFTLILMSLKLSFWLGPQTPGKPLFILTLTSGMYFIAAVFTFISVQIMFPMTATAPAELLPTLDLQNRISEFARIQDIVEAQTFSFLWLILGFMAQFFGALYLLRRI